MSDLYQQLCNMLIRPTRQIYHLYDLGNPLIGTHGKRQDFQILSRSNLKVKCSFYHSFQHDNNVSVQLPTVIYLHSLNGSRLEFLSNVEPLLKLGFNIATLDFTGCGLSEGSYVTLGAHQKWDVLQLIKYIYKIYKDCNFMIWGRSMGAVAAIKFCTLFQQQKQYSRELQEIKILGLILDSPFVSLNQLAVQIAKNRINIPQIVIKMAFYMIQSSIQTKANFKTSELQLQNQVKKIKCPTLIITSKKDTLVPYEHSLTIYSNISSDDKQLMYIETQHNNNRQEIDIQKIYQFLKQKSKILSPRKTFYTGTTQKKLQKLQSASIKKPRNLTLSKEKLNRNQSQKNQIILLNNKNFFMSHVGQQNPIRIQDQNILGTKHRARDFSLQKISIDEDKKYIEKDKKQANQSHAYFSADRPKVVFVKQMHQSCAINNLTKKQQLRAFDLYSKLASVPQNKFMQKPFTHSLSYKNIECLKTVKKIKRLEPELEDNLNEQKQQYDSVKNHMNVITAKLQKKSKHILTKSFLPQQAVQNVNQSMPQQQKTLKRQLNAKSSTIIQFSKQRKSILNKSIHKSGTNQKPATPACFSNRQISFNQMVPKPFTPQYPLHSSMRINQIQKRRQSTSKQDFLKIYSMQPINECNRGIKTTLNLKYSTNINDQNNNNQVKYQSVAGGQEIVKPEFMSCKNMLSSQIIQMRAQNSNINRSKKYLIQNKRQIIQHQQETSISLK